MRAHRSFFTGGSMQLSIAQGVREAHKVKDANQRQAERLPRVDGASMRRDGRRRRRRRRRRRGAGSDGRLRELEMRVAALEEAEILARYAKIMLAVERRVRRISES